MQTLQPCSKPSNLLWFFVNSLSGFSILQCLHFFIFVFLYTKEGLVFFEVKVFWVFIFLVNLVVMGGGGGGLLGFLVEKEKNSTPGGFRKPLGTRVSWKWGGQSNHMRFNAKP